MAELVRVRQLTDAEGQTLQRIVQHGKHGSIRQRWALIIMAWASGTMVAAIDRVLQADVDTKRDVIHALNRMGLNTLDPRWAGSHPRQISAEDVACSSRRPPIERRSWGVRAHTGACGSWPIT